MQIGILGVSKSYGSAKVLEQVTARISGNSVTALVGPSGAGKSTLLSIIGGSTPPDEGKVVIEFGGRSNRPSPRLVAWVPQGSNALPHRSARDNAAIGSLARGCSWEDAYAAADTALAQVGIQELSKHDARQLSGGELQRLGFARALCAQRPLILADEPTANLDEANTILISGILNALSGTATIIVATHDPLLVSAADSVINLRELGSRV